MIDYSDIYDDYWMRPDRIGESSFADPTPIARQILATCGPGRILDVGSGMGTLVLELLKQGADAYGVDVSSVVARRSGNYAKGRFFAGSILSLPFPDDSFDTLISTDCLEHLSPEDVPFAFKELRRVCRRNLFLRIATSQDRDGHWHLTVEKRNWWEDVAFSSGFRKHPKYYEITPFHALESEGNTITIPLEKIPDSSLSQYPLSKLLEQRELHMDMSRETGRRSDAHMARYQLASNFIRDGDTVLDSACGMGYGTRLLAWQSSATNIIGIDLDQEAIDYANGNFAQPNNRISFRSADVLQLDFIPDNSIDLFVSFETLEHVPYPDRLIAEAYRILRPGGRFIVSVPNRWVNEEGLDPNPYHLHVYDWERLKNEIQSCFLLEAAYAQTAGGGMKLTTSPRSMFEFIPEGAPPVEAEWWLAVGMKDFINSKMISYKETALYWHGTPPNAVAFARDYVNPWIARGIVSKGWRNRNKLQRDDLARRTLSNSPPNSPDAGAALCILAYSLFDSANGISSDDVYSLNSQIDRFVTCDDAHPQIIRWRISLLYVQGLLWQSIGEIEKSLDSFRCCASTNALKFSPLLATKTVDACRLAGKLCFQQGRADESRLFWTQGIKLAEEALHGDWREIYGDIEYPFTFGLREAAQILDSASRCADGLHHLMNNDSGRGLPDNESFIAKLTINDKQLENVTEELAILKRSPYFRLQKAVKNDPPSLRRFVRITYLLALIFTPSWMKIILRPLVNPLRRHIK